MKRDTGEIEVGGELTEGRLAAIMVRGLLLRNMCAGTETVLKEYAEPVPAPYGDATWSNFRTVAQHSDGETPWIELSTPADPDLFTEAAAEVHMGDGECMGVFAAVPYDSDMGRVPVENAEAIVHAGRDLIDLVREVISLRAELETARQGREHGERMGAGAAVSSHVVGPFLASLDPCTRIVLDGIVAHGLDAQDHVFELLNQPVKAAAVIGQLPAGYLAELLRVRPDFPALAVWASIASVPTACRPGGRNRGGAIGFELPWQGDAGSPYVDVVVDRDSEGEIRSIDVQNCLRENVRIGESIDRSDGKQVLRIAGVACDPVEPVEMIKLQPSPKDQIFGAMPGVVLQPLSAADPGASAVDEAPPIHGSDLPADVRLHVESGGTGMTSHVYAVDDQGVRRRVRGVYDITWHTAARGPATVALEIHPARISADGVRVEPDPKPDTLLWGDRPSLYKAMPIPSGDAPWRDPTIDRHDYVDAPDRATIDDIRTLYGLEPIPERGGRERWTSGRVANPCSTTESERASLKVRVFGHPVLERWVASVLARTPALEENMVPTMPAELDPE